jgi:tRNA 2-thiouridine synthesizing protein A
MRNRKGGSTMAKVVDVRGFSCPQPVILTRRAIQEGQFPIEVLVETVTSRENVRRASEKMGCRVEVQVPGTSGGKGDLL